MKRTKKTFYASLLTFTMFVLVFAPLKAQAATSPSLGNASTYSILAGSEVTNVGSTTISGDVGISPGIGAAPHYTGFGTVTLGGNIHDADGNALAAQADKNTAYTALAAQTCDTTYVGAFKSLDGEILAPGVYCADQFRLSGTLTLNGAASDVWIFKSAADLIISSGAAANVVFTGGGLPCNVWWRVVSTATFDANSTLVGNILADTSITMAAGAGLEGRAFAGTAEVTLSSNSVTGPDCTAPSSGGSGSGRRVIPPVEDTVFPPGLTYVAPVAPLSGNVIQLPVTGISMDMNSIMALALFSLVSGFVIIYSSRRKQEIPVDPRVKVTYL